MRFFNMGYEPYTHIVATGEKSAGNDSVGNMWIETKVFDKSTPVSDIIEWANSIAIDGKLIITISEPDTIPVKLF